MQIVYARLGSLHRYWLAPKVSRHRGALERVTSVHTAESSGADTPSLSKVGSRTEDFSKGEWTGRPRTVATTVAAIAAIVTTATATADADAATATAACDLLPVCQLHPLHHLCVCAPKPLAFLLAPAVESVA